MTISEFFRRSFLDPRGEPDAKQLTLFVLTVIVVLQFPVYWVWKVAVPDYLWVPVVGMLAVGYGFSANENKAQIEADAAVKQAEVTGQNPQPAVGSSDTTIINQPST